jgi:hypothetical protein
MEKRRIRYPIPYECSSTVEQRPPNPLVEGSNPSTHATCRIVLGVRGAGKKVSIRTLIGQTDIWFYSAIG